MIIKILKHIARACPAVFFLIAAAGFILTAPSSAAAAAATNSDTSIDISFTDEAAPAAGFRRFMFALGGGACKILKGPGPALTFGYGGSFIFQAYLFKGLGLDLHASFYYNADRKYHGNYITILPAVISPLYRINTKYIDISFRAGAGISYTASKAGSRLNLYPTGDPALPITGLFIPGSRGQSIDFSMGAGAGISHTFDTGVVLGLEINYYYIFQTLSAHALSASVYCGYAF